MKIQQHFSRLLQLMLGILTCSTSGATIEARLTSQKVSLIVGEPLLLDLVISNTGSAELSMASGVGPTESPGAAMGTIQISRNDGLFVDWNDGLRPVPRSLPFRLPAGGTLNFKYAVYFNRKTGLAFPAAGTYRVRWNYREYQPNREGTDRLRKEFPSNVLGVDVTNPNGEDATVWDSLRVDAGHGVLMQCPWRYDLSPEAERKYTTLITAYPKSTYMPHYTLAIAKALGRGGFQGDSNRQARARTLLPSVARMTTNSTLVERADRLLQELNQLLPPPPVRTAYGDMVLKLEGEFYDVRGYMRETDKHSDELKAILRDADSKLVSGMTREEVDRYRRQKLEPFLRKHLRPLPPDEWKRRQEISLKIEEQEYQRQQAELNALMEQYKRSIEATKDRKP